MDGVARWVISQTPSLSPPRPPAKSLPKSGAARTRKWRDKKTPEEKIFDGALKRAREQTRDCRKIRMLPRLLRESGLKVAGKIVRVGDPCAYLCRSGILHMGIVIDQRMRLKKSWVLLERLAKARSPKKPLVLEAVEREYVKKISC